MKDKHLKTSVLMVLSTLFLLMIAVPASADEKQDPKPSHAAMVNGKGIAYADFEREYQIYKSHYASRSPNLPPVFLQKLRNQIVNEMVNQELLYQVCQKKKIQTSKADLDREVATFKNRFDTPEKYKAWLASMNFTADGFETQFGQRLAVQKLIEQEVVSKIAVKEEDAKIYFEKNPGKYSQKESVRARHILVKLDKTADAKAKEDARKQLMDIKKKLLAGEDFETLAKTHSQGPSSARGGDLGYFTKGQMVKPFEEAAFQLAVNEVSDIVETKFGYHLIKVLDHKAAVTPTFEEVKDKTLDDLRKERIQSDVSSYIATLRSKAKIETFIK